jgi:hypothetical protein
MPFLMTFLDEMHLVDSTADALQNSRFCASRARRVAMDVWSRIIDVATPRATEHDRRAVVTEAI